MADQEREMGSAVPAEVLKQAYSYLDRMDERGNQRVRELITPYESSGDPEIHRMLGVLSNREGDYEKAMEYFLSAAKKGNGKAQASVGEYCLYGVDGYIEPDFGEAWKWLTAAEAQGCSRAYNLLGDVYCGEYEIPKDMERAIAYFKKALDSEEKWVRGVANCRLGCIYLTEDGYVDYAKAEEALQAAAEQGEETALLILRDYYTGEFGGVGPVSDQLRDWYEKAAQRDEEAMFSLGEYYRADENGVIRDLGQAVFWYKQAEKYGYREDIVERNLVILLGAYLDERQAAVDRVKAMGKTPRDEQ